MIQTRITDPSGFAALGVVPQALAGTYSVKAFFGPGGPTPPTLVADPVYATSSAAGSSLSVSPVAVSSIALAGASPTNATTVSWTVTFSGSVTAPTTSNFTLVQKNGLSGAGNLSVVAAGGNVFTVSASTGNGDGQLGLSVTGITDSVGGPISGTLTGPSYTVDKSAPSSAITFPVNGAAYRATTYGAGPCSKVGICGTAADPSGVGTVKLSIRNSAGAYWNGSAFSGTTETFLAATLASPGGTSTAWSYAFGLPADGAYTVHVQAADVLGNTQASPFATSVFTIDTVAPSIAFAGNKGTYGLLDTVSVTCTATDPAPASGLKAPNPCTGFSIAGPASSFKPTNTLPSPGLVATDNAGNSSAPATTSFTVSATPTTLCQLTQQFTQSSAKYAALSPLQKAVVNALTSVLCQSLNAIVPKLSPTAKAQLITAYKTGVQSLVTQGWLTAAQAATLTTFVATL